MSNKSIIKSILPNAREEMRKVNFSNEEVYFIRNGNAFTPLAEGKTAAKAWKNALPIVLSMAKVAIEKMEKDKFTRSKTKQ